MIFEGLYCTAPQPHTHTRRSSRVVCCQPSATRPSCRSPFQWCGCPIFSFVFWVKLVGFHRALEAEIDEIHMKSQQFLWIFWAIRAIPSRMFCQISFSLLRCQICFRKKTLVGWPRYPMFFFFTGDINHSPWRTRSCTTPEYFTSC